jgi:CHASE2 domain-containing sensor protein
LFDGLHNWDLGWLDRRPIWDIWMVLGSLAGLALSLTSVVIGWRRLRRKFLSNVVESRPVLSRVRE